MMVEVGCVGEDARVVAVRAATVRVVEVVPGVATFAFFRVCTGTSCTSGIAGFTLGVLDEVSERIADAACVVGMEIVVVSAVWSQAGGALSLSWS